MSYPVIVGMGPHTEYVCETAARIQETLERQGATSVKFRGTAPEMEGVMGGLRSWTCLVGGSRFLWERDGWRMRGEISLDDVVIYDNIDPEMAAGSVAFWWSKLVVW